MTTTTEIEPRPRTLTPEMKIRCATNLVDELRNAGRTGAFPFESEERAVASIAVKGRTSDDGYDLAKELDRDYGWSCNLQVAEILDGFRSLARQEIATAEKNWAVRTGIKPPFPDGTAVRLSHKETGVIDCIDVHGAAKYLIKIDGDDSAGPPTNRRRVVNFEDVEAMKEEAAPCRD